MNTFRMNKILGTVLGTLLFLQTVHIVDGAFKPHKVVEPGSKVAVKEGQPAEAKEAWRSRLNRQLCHHLTIDFGVDPELIAGAELHLPNAVLRFSWQSALAAMRAEIEADGDAG